jgi:hypothetical protein
LAKKTAGQIDKGTSGTFLKSAVFGFRLSKYHWPNVGWVECNETQQSMEVGSTQPTKCIKARDKNDI